MAYLTFSKRLLRLEGRNKGYMVGNTLMDLPGVMLAEKKPIPYTCIFI